MRLSAGLPRWLKDLVLRAYGTVDIAPGPRSLMLHRQAYREEGRPYPARRMKYLPFALLYPRSFIERIAALPGEKIHDYAFVGGLFRDDTYPNRKWIIDFARERFTERSYYCVTDPPAGYEPLGSFDRTLDDHDLRVIPKDMPAGQRDFFDPHYFRVMRQARFTLCPAGDQPWSMRFFEAIMCRSIPVLERTSHAWRNPVERAIGYRFYLTGADHVDRPDWIDENYRKFLAHQSLVRPPLPAGLDGGCAEGSPREEMG